MIRVSMSYSIIKGISYLQFAKFEKGEDENSINFELGPIPFAGALAGSLSEDQRKSLIEFLEIGNKNDT